MDFEVSIANSTDEDVIFDYLKIMHEENAVFHIDEEKVRNFIKMATDRKNGVIGIIKGDDGLEGMICLVVDQLWYSHEWFLNEVFNFVHPEHRKSTRAKSLLAFAKNISDEMELPLLVGVVSNYRTEAKVKLYERQFPKAGAFFMYNSNYARVAGHG